MRVVIVAQGSQGDVAPMVPLGKGLHAAGHEVLVCANSNFEDLFSGNGLPYRSVGPDTRRMLTERKGELVSPIAGARSVIGAIRGSFSYYFDTLPAIVRGADMLLGSGVDFCGSSIAELCRVPYRYFVSIPQTFRSRHHPPMVVPFQRLPGMANRALWWLSGRLLGLEKPYNEQRVRFGLKPVPDVVGLMTKRAIAAFDPELANVPADVRADCRQVGSLHAELNGTLEPEVGTFLDAGPAPVFIGFGSMPQHDAARIAGAVGGLADAGRCRVVLSRGWGDFPMAHRRENVLPVDFVPYAALFPRVAMVVHHGGSGTTHAAARAGVPQLIVPHMLDQFYWADRVRRLGLGLGALGRKRLSGSTLTAAVEKTLTEPGYAARARSLGESMRRKDAVAAAVQVIEDDVRAAGETA
jgi:vancomycin aglycone glucosyltransferase